MKLSNILLEQRQIRVGHIGASTDPNNPESGIWGDNDEWHVSAAFKWLDKYTNDSEWLFYDRCIDDYIDLNDGRDFLQEHHKYDIVILHMVYSPPYRITNNDINSSSPFKVSRLHTQQNWRRRLLSTNAKYIFTFGDGDEVHGKYLGHLQGYEGPIDGGNYLQVYFRKP